MQRGEDFLKKWEDIINDVDLDHIPLECVKKMVFKLYDKKQKTINFQLLKKQGLDIDGIHVVVERFIQENQDNIVNMDFILDIEAVAEILQPETDKLLGKL
jgi:hypothetical protein